MSSGNEKAINRRDLIKKAAKTGAFVLPTMVSYKVTELHAEASGGFPTEPKKPTFN